MAVSVKRIKLNVDEGVLAMLNALVAVRCVMGASGTLENVALTLLTEIEAGKDEFLIGLCDGKIVVEAV